jgi:two-component system cell cycle sensor histidine kinase/response regulator CckA
LAGGVAHDFNNILAIIDGYGRMIAKRTLDKPECQDQCLKILQAVKRGSALTQRLLTFSRHRIQNEQRINLGEHLEDLKSLFKPLLSSSIDVSIETQDKLYIEGSSDSLTQIILNLVVNARDAMPDGGQISIRCRSMDCVELPNSIDLGLSDENEQRLVKIEIEDTGIGMDNKILQHIYEPFFTTKEQGRGTGLGLSLVYGLVRELNGHIEVSSIVGKGTIFTIYLVQSSHAPLQNDFIRTQASGIHSFDGLRILIVEDEEDLRLILQTTLMDMGFDVVSARHGSDALAIYDELDGEFDCVLTDIIMPELNGLKLGELLSEIDPQLPIFYMSGYPARGDLSDYKLPEQSIFLAKPLDYNLLREHLTQKLLHKNLHTESILQTSQWT